MARRETILPAPYSNDNGGCLYVVATPIGNLEDITLRALRLLKEVDVIACEDTRRTTKLLNHYDIQKRLVSYHEHNEIMRAPELVIELEQGARIALVSDAGLPGVSDPGHHLISLAIRHGIPVIPLPGPTAFSAALIASGLAAPHFHFYGFLPSRRTQRRKALQGLAGHTGMLIFYEAPHRIRDSLADVLAMLGDRPAVLAREVTKKHEEFLRGRISHLVSAAGERKLKGEITLVVGPPDDLTEQNSRQSDGAGEPISVRLSQLQSEKKLDQKSALKEIARELGLSRSEAYRRLQEEKALKQ